jgi:hypothetical protein
VTRENKQVWYGWPTPFILSDIVDLSLIYEQICDAEGGLETPRKCAAPLSDYILRNEKIDLESMLDWELGDVFVMVGSVFEYVGYDMRNIVFSDKFDRRLMRLDHLKIGKRRNCAYFQKLLSEILADIKTKDASVIEKVGNFLKDIEKLYDEKVIFPRERQKRTRARSAMSDLVAPAVELDLRDNDFITLTKECSLMPPWFTAFMLDEQLLESSFEGMPLHLWSPYLPLVEYKYLRGARYFGNVKVRSVFTETFTTLIPEIYVLNIPELLEIRQTRVFRKFREEIYDTLTKEKPLEASYIREQYLKEIEDLAIQRRPRPHMILLKTLLSNVHPLVGLLLGGKEVYDEYRQRYTNWKLALSVVDLKRELRKHGACLLKAK